MKICSTEGCGTKHSAKGLCRRCYERIRMAKKRATNPDYLEKERAYGRDYVAKRRADRSPEEKEKSRQRARARNTGMTQEMCNELRAHQRNQCGICLVNLIGAGRGPSCECADHCHSTGQVRGLLCTTCNKTLGFYEKHQRERFFIDAYEDYLGDSPWSRLQARRLVNALPSPHERATELRDSTTGTFRTEHGPEKLEDVLQRGSSLSEN